MLIIIIIMRRICSGGTLLRRRDVQVGNVVVPVRTCRIPRGVVAQVGLMPVPDASPPHTLCTCKSASSTLQHVTLSPLPPPNPHKVTMNPLPAARYLPDTTRPLLNAQWLQQNFQLASRSAGQARFKFSRLPR
jgi:hypothetical protein